MTGTDMECWLREAKESSLFRKSNICFLCAVKFILIILLKFYLKIEILNIEVESPYAHMHMMFPKIANAAIR